MTDQSTKLLESVDAMFWNTLGPIVPLVVGAMLLVIGAAWCKGLVSNPFKTPKPRGRK